MTVTHSGPRAVVVIGGGLAGAFAAAAASAPGRTVTLLERDRLPALPSTRRGVPQGPQPHVLLRRGILAAEELLPGLAADLLAAGAVRFDSGDLAWLGDSGWSLTGRPQFELLSATRPLVEHVVHARVRALPGVSLRDQSQVVALRRLRTQWRVELAGGSVLTADLVVDASGRGSRLPVWLADAGVPAARTTEVDARIGYASRLVRVPPTVSLPAGIVLQQVPSTLTGGIALPVEDGCWLIGVVGAGDRRPARDDAGFAAALEQQRDPALAELARAATPLTAVAVHRQTANRRHHFEDVDHWPTGLLVIGDALCSFNPVYGQGVAVAACQALVLRRALAARGLRPGGERRVQSRLAGVTALPWAIATAEDLRYPTSAGGQSLLQVLLGRWTRELGRLSTHGDVRAAAALAGVYHLMAHPAVLVHPALVLSVLRARVRGHGPPEPRPAALAGLTGPTHDDT